MNQVTEWPSSLLECASWDFEDRPAYPDQEAFERAVADYLEETAEDRPPDSSPDEAWNPSASVLSSRTILVRYYSDPLEGAAGFETVLLRSDSAEGFTAAELLFKIHNGTIERLSTSGHHWFEGLDFAGVSADGTPEYEMIPGS